MHPRLAEILTYLARVRSDLAAFIAATPREALSRRPGDGVWSGAQVIYHCGNAEGATTKMLEGLFAKGLADGLPNDEATTSLLHSLDPLRVPDRTFRPLVAPERLRPPDAPDFDAAWASLQKVRERTHRAVATVDGRDLTRLSAPHPFLGPLDGYQWVLFLGQHEERHLRQMVEMQQRLP